MTMHRALSTHEQVASSDAKALAGSERRDTVLWQSWWRGGMRARPNMVFIVWAK